MKTSDIKILKQENFQSENVVNLAKFLLNKYLISQVGQKTSITQIVETEAYRAPDDKACHAYQNKKTNRTKTMFLKGGVSYIYLCYGIHNMLNVVTAPKGKAHAILIRAVQPITGIDIIQQRRTDTKGYNLTNGPGKLCQALGIDRSLDAMELYKRDSKIWLGDNKNLNDNDIESGARVGISYAEECAMWPWRFKIKDNKWTSKPDTVEYE